MAVITGAASGIGAAFAELCAQQGFDLLLIDRDAARLSEVAQALRSATTAVTALTCDLAAPEELRRAVAAIDDLPHVDLLVNSAGISEGTPFIAAQADVLHRVIAVNCAALVGLSHAAAQKMVARRSGRIINLSSLGGIVPVFVDPVYGATKGFVLHFSKGLHRQLRGSGVYVQALCPGHTRSGLHTAAHLRHLPAVFFEDPHTVVAASWEAARRGRLVCIPTLRHRAILTLARTGLLSYAWRLARKIDRLRH